MILYKTIIRSSDSIIAEPILNFILSLSGSIFIALLTGLIIAYLLKNHYQFGTQQKNIEIICMGLCPWVTYLLAEVKF